MGQVGAGLEASVPWLVRTQAAHCHSVPGLGFATARRLGSDTEKPRRWGELAGSGGHMQAALLQASEAFWVPGEAMDVVWVGQGGLKVTS